MVVTQALTTPLLTRRSISFTTSFNKAPPCGGRSGGKLLSGTTTKLKKILSTSEVNDSETCIMSVYSCVLEKSTWQKLNRSFPDSLQSIRTN